MATSFGGAGGKFSQVLKNPLLIGAILVVVLVGIYFWRRHQTTAGSVAATPVSGQLQGTVPGTTNSPDQLGLSQGDLQNQLSNLTTQISTGFAGLSSGANGGSNVAPGLFTIGQPSGYGSPAGSGQPGSGIPIYSSPTDPNTFEGEIGWNSPVQVVPGTLQTGRMVPGLGNQWEQIIGPTGLRGWAFLGDLTSKAQGQQSQ